jgi:hypothetical protein
MEGGFLQRQNNGWFRGSVGLRYHLISGTADIRPKCLQLLKKLSFVHDG